MRGVSGDCKEKEGWERRYTAKEYRGEWGEWGEWSVVKSGEQASRQADKKVEEHE